MFSALRFSNLVRRGRGRGMQKWRHGQLNLHNLVRTVMKVHTVWSRSTEDSLLV